MWDKDGAGEIYCPDICPYNSCQYFPYNTSTLSALQWRPGNPTMLPRQDYVPCAHQVQHYLPPAYLTILIESDEGQIEKALNTRMFRCCLFSRATNVTLSQCPFLSRKCLLQSSLWEVSLSVSKDKLLGTSKPESIICGQCLNFPTEPINIPERHKNVDLGKCCISLKKCKVHTRHAF